MRVIDRHESRRHSHPRKPSRDRRNAREASADRPAPQLEPLETRSLLSTVLNGFPSAGFRADTLDDTPPWDVAVVVDNQRISAQGFAELTEQLPDAPGLERSEAGTNWIAGIIGDTRLRGSDADTNDVDIYRIDLPAGDHYAVSLQVLAQRFGSSLDPAVSILDENGRAIASNDDALHAGFLSDAELFTGLNGGTYYVAVFAGGNLPGEGGFNPRVPGSAYSSRGTTGQYLLQFSATPDATRPVVVHASIEPGSTLHSVPTEITVRFSEPMHLLGLAEGATLAHSNGDQITLRAISYDSVNHEVRYRLLDRPVAGDYQFTLHAAQIQDRADNPLDGGAPGGDFNLTFYLDTPTVNRVDTEPSDTATTAQPLGPLFVTELRNGVVINGSVSATDIAGDHDYYSFQVMYTGFYTFRLTPGQGTAQTGSLRLYDATSKQLAQSGRFPGLSSSLIRWLKPGEYLIEMDGSGNAPPGSYQLTIHGFGGDEIPLIDNDPTAAVQVVLRTHDGEKPPESEPASSTSTESSTVALTPMSYSVTALPTVASQPAGQPQPPTASPTELAWVDQTSGGQALPAGFSVRGPSPGPIARFSVSGVSGTFHDSLPDAMPHGTHALDPSMRLVSELAALFRGGFGDGAAGSGAATAGDTGLAADAGDESLDMLSAEWIDDAAEVAISPPTLALGMVASIGAASVMNVPNRRRSNWVQRAFELLGIR